jgi:UDP-N-acetylmuramate dehydrogenase
VRGSRGASTGRSPAAAVSAGGFADRAGSNWAELAAEIRGMAGVHMGRGESLAEHTTMRVGGPADLLVVVHEISALATLIRHVRSRGIRYLVLGRGSDVVVSDAGIRGLVILCRAEGCRIDGERLIADAGLPMAKAATVAQQAGLSGLEFGLAIPGTVGGAVWANAGAHGADVAAVLESVSVLRADGEEVLEPAASLGLGYRESRFKPAAEDWGAALVATQLGAAAGATQFAAAAGASAGATQPGATTGASVGSAYPDLILEATFRLATATPAEIRARLDEIRRWRRQHQPLSLPSAGSVFRNPPGDSAGRLIDACGLKGTRLGGAAISELHANFIVNEGGASATDIRRLAERARVAVAARFGVDLVYEVEFIGDWSNWHPEVQ